MTKKNIDAAALSQELDNVVAQLQSDDVNVDAALKLYEKGIDITQQLEDYLKTAENKITKLKINSEGK